MTAKWARIERGSLLDRILASSVAVILLVIALGDPFPPAARGAAPSEPKNLAAYFVSWHVIARGSVSKQFSNANGWQEDHWTEISEMTGSAIVRYSFRNEVPSYFDTRFLTVKARENKDYWGFHHFYYDNCVAHDAHTIADTGSYSGLKDPNLRVLADVQEYRNGVITKFYRPFGPLMAMHFIQHTQNEGCTADHVSDMITGLGALQADDPDLSADPKNPSSFYFSKKFSSTKLGLANLFPTMEVEWTAHAYLMGKCAERDGPIQEDDPVVQSEGEDVHIDTDDADIAPDGKTKVHIRVTCEGVPVEGAKVKIEVEPVDSSGGHIHVNDRPKGKLDGKNLTGADPSITRTTDKDGKVKGVAGITFAPPGKDPISRCLGVSGDYKVTATSEKFKDRKDSTMIVVRLKENLVMLGKSQNYDICADSVHGCSTEGPWGTTDHPDSEYGTAGTIQAFQGVATEFWNQQQSHNQLLQSCKKNPWPMKKVSFNDIALPWGGLFDMNSTWRQPHKTHGRGQGGDFNHFRGNSCDQGACLSCGGATVNFDAFLWNVLKFTAQPKYGHWDGEVDTTGELHLHVEDQGQGPPKDCPADN